MVKNVKCLVSVSFHLLILYFLPLFRTCFATEIVSVSLKVSNFMGHISFHTVHLHLDLFSP